MVLFVFVIMLLNAGAENTKDKSRSSARYVGVPLLIVFLGVISCVIQALFPQTTKVEFGGFYRQAAPSASDQPSAGALHGLPVAFRSHFGADPDRH